MRGLIKTPEELLAYRPLKELLAAKGTAIHAVAPEDSVLTALQRMAEHGTGFLVVLEGARLAGVFSERDHARKVSLQDRSPMHTQVRDVMTTHVVTVTTGESIPRCMALMSEQNFRHLPVMDGDRVVGVLSIRDLLRAVIRHHERLIRDLEMEMMTVLNPNSSGY